MLEGALGSDLARLCITKLSGFLEDQDQNREALNSCILDVPDADDTFSQVYRVISSHEDRPNAP